MGYFESVLADRPAAYWPLNETSGTVGADYSGFGHNATKSSVGAAFPLANNSKFSASSSAPSDAITFPLVGLGIQYTESVSFSLEFIFKPGSYNANVSIFKMGTNVGAFCLNGKVIFKITGTNPDASTESVFVGYTLPNNAARHIVVTYAYNSIKLFIDGVKVDDATLSGQFVFAAPPANYTYFTTTGFSALSHVALYKYELNPVQINNHFSASRATTILQEIANQDSGIIFQPSDRDRIAALECVLPTNIPWSQATLTDCFVDENGWVTLRDIPNAILNTGSLTSSSTDITLSSSQYLRIPNADLFCGQASGAFGGSFFLDSTTHNNASKYVMFSISDATGQNAISVYKSNIGNIAVDQDYIDINGVAQTATSNVAAASYGAYVYVYITYDSAAIRLYVANNTTFGEIDLATTASFNMTSGSYITIGADQFGLLPWSFKTKMFTGYRTIPSLVTFASQATTVGPFTYPLNSTVGLTASQFGTVDFKVGTGFIGTLSESRAVWHPRPSNIVFKGSVDGNSYTTCVFNDDVHGSMVNGATAPASTYFRVELSTADSINDVPKLYDAGIKIMLDDPFYAEAGYDRLVTTGQYHIGNDDFKIFDNTGVDGIYFDMAGGFYLIPQDDSGITPHALDGSTGSITAGDVRLFKTVELWVRQYQGFTGTTTQYMFDHITPGSVHYSFYHDGSTGTEKFVGFDTCFVNGVSFASNTALQFVNGWAHVVLTKAVFTGLAPLSSNPGRFNFNMDSSSANKGNIQYKIVGLYPNIFTVNDSIRHYNQFIGNLTTRISETAVRSVIDHGVALYSAAWNITGSG